jgi:nucleoside-diphosphate-sugar epimerase
MHIAMTGLTRGIGVRLASAALARGDSVAGLVHDPARREARDLEARGVRLVKGDLDDHRALRELTAGAGVLVSITWSCRRRHFNRASRHVHDR